MSLGSLVGGDISESLVRVRRGLPVIPLALGLERVLGFGLRKGPRTGTVGKGGRSTLLDLAVWVITSLTASNESGFVDSGARCLDVPQ